jgi:hypothetical protein
MHNVRVPSQKPQSMTRAVAPMIATVVALGLAACSSSGGDSSAKASASPTSTISVPSGVSLTDEGSTLSFGQSATVIFAANQKRGSTIEVSVKKAVKGSVSDFKRFILDDPYKKKADYYYVYVTVKNVGEGDVGGVPVPLWGVNAKNVLLPAVNFTTHFAKCPSKPLPAKFAAGASFSTCLVYLSPNHGTLESVSYRPTQAFNPITWTGHVFTAKPQPKKAPKHGKKNKKSGNKG